MNFLVCQGLGDIVWSMLKIQDIADKLSPKYGPGIHLRIACYHNNNVESRALDFVRRFRFVDSAEMYAVPIQPGKAGPVLLPGPPADEDGYYRYLPDGPVNMPGIDYALMPNAPLERGLRIEDWLPEYRVNWGIFDDLVFHPQELEYADKLADELGPYVVFYPGPEGGNTVNGHNRGMYWRPEDWAELGRRIVEKYRVQIVVTGADYDRSYYEHFVRPLVRHPLYWHDHIGKHGINETYAMVRKAKFIVSYQSGIGIIAHYFGIPTAIFWRPRGDSLNTDFFVSFEEEMASAWANPEFQAQGKHLPLIYGRHDVDYLTAEIDSRGW